MWRKRTYLKNSKYGKRKQKRKDGRSNTTRRTQTIVQDEITAHPSQSAAKLANLPDTTNSPLDATAASSGEAPDHNKTQDAPLNRRLEPFGSDDWNWLKTNDAAIREQRRVAGDDGTPRIGITNDHHDVTKSTTVQPAPFEQTHPEPEVAPQATELSEGIARDEFGPLRPRTWAGERARPENTVQVAGNNADAFFELFPSQRPEDESDEAQLRFEQELEKEQQGVSPDSALDDLGEVVEEKSDDWFDRTKRSSIDEMLGFEWQEFSFDADEFDEAPDRTEWSREVRTDGRVSRKLRALQEATTLAQEYAWDERGTELLAEVFERYFWSSAKASMRRELERGMTPEELEVALGLRDFWRGRTEFSIDLMYRRSDAAVGADTSRAIYHTLSWPAALRLIRMVNSIPDQAEIEVFLDELYREWYSSNGLRVRYPSFRVYLYRWVEYIEKRSDLVATWSAFVDTDQESEFNEDDERESAWMAHDRNELACEGLLPTGGDERYVEMISHAERNLLGEVLAERSVLCP